ncbi:MAG: hypothetical protein M1820_004771 [Bogoriella megaspora]|nr:MAG: hypothetical protein M1820_004771 [Bogoriella megaspora]
MASPSLFEPMQIGTSKLNHRVVMSPLTRFRAEADHVPTTMMLEYYQQRATVPGTLLTTEATFISDEAAAYERVPGIWNDSQVAAWKKITDAVHAKGSFINLQLWALGRTGLPEILARKGFELTGVSAVPHSPGAATPRPLTEEEIEKWINQYAIAAKNSIRAGFDGVEIHGANGYLIDQFIQDTSNQRSDKWGGSIENRSRFALSVAKAVVDAIGPERTGIRLSPFTTFQGMGMEDPAPQFSNVIEGLRKLDLSFIHVIMGSHRPAANKVYGRSASPEMVEFVFKAWGSTKPVILAGQFNSESARKAVEEEYKDHLVAIGFGRDFISNPDLPFRLSKQIELKKYDDSTFYLRGDPKGYVDYPFSNEFLTTKL